jgi:hypothetical protein
MKNLLFSAFIALLILAFEAQAQDAISVEKIGRLTVEEILLRPTYSSIENKGGDFGFDDSSFKVRWQKDNNVSATIAVGSVLQKNIPAYYVSATPSDTLGFYEAYADYQGLYGRVRAGLQPLNFGFYGAQPNGERIFPRPLVYQQRMIGLRDYGVSFYTAHNGFYTELIGHNGEVDNKPADGNVWATARWGWGNDRNIRVQASAQTGRTKVVSTTAGSTNYAGFDNTKGALWRFGAFSAHWYPRKWEITAQALAGEREQTDLNGKDAVGGIFAAQFEIVNYIGDRWGWGLRHDEFDPNDKVNKDKQTQESLLLFMKSADSTSMLSFIFSKDLEEKNQTPDDQLLVSWRLTPFIGR